MGDGNLTASKFKNFFGRWGEILVISVLIVILIVPNLRNLSFNVWFGSVATGLCFAFVAIGVYITFRVLDFPDLTMDGSFPLGAAISASLISAGNDPYFSLLVAFVGGALAGMTTALIATRLKIHSLLASILTTTALMSINLRIMGRSNIPLLKEKTIFSPISDPFRSFISIFEIEWLEKISTNLMVILFIGLIVVLFKLALDWGMLTEIGLALQATGDNPQMVRALGTDTDRMLIVGVAFSNGLIGISGAIFSQYQGFADVNMGLGLIISGMAAVIIGETIFRNRNLINATTAVILGMIIYRIAIAAALNIKIPLPGGDIFRINAQDVKLASAALVFFALWYSHKKRNRVQE